MFLLCYVFVQQELQALHRHLNLGNWTGRRHLLSRLLPQDVLAVQVIFKTSLVQLIYLMSSTELL